MPKFTTRVELYSEHLDDVPDYETLNQHMVAKGFAQTITIGDSETILCLPSGEYDFSGDVTRMDVLELAKSAAAETGRDASILITEAMGRTGYRLKPR